MPKVSVVMPAYNAEAYIGAAIESILNQSFTDFEFLILNDCSADGTEDIIKSYNDSRIVYLKNEKNMGVAATLNKGFAVAQGDYIARMDADDIAHPRRFEQQVAYLDAHPEVAVLGTQVRFFSVEGDGEPFCYSGSCAQLKIDLLFASAIAHPSVMLRRQMILDLGGYDSQFEGLEDYELWCRVSQQAALAVYPEILLRYRIHPGQVTQQPSERKQRAARNLKQRQLLRLGLPTEGAVAAAYYNYQTKEPKTYETALAEIRFFEALINANEEKKLYDQKLLKKLMRQLAKSNAVGLAPHQQRALCRKTKLLCYPSLLLSRLKQILLR
ncbi:MAG: glycosyltransferase [Oscillospiraceae bacterium]|nr:glycosyltransferase [Oscillospiraceae bacterium]